MKIKRANKKEITLALNLAKNLKEWFNRDAIIHMKIDFKLNNLILVLDKKKIAGFLCYNSYEGFTQIVWMGVSKEYQGEGVGTLMLNWLIKEVKKIGSQEIRVETLTDKEKYKPYSITRDFYYKCGFKKIREIPPRKKGWDTQILMEKKIK